MINRRKPRVLVRGPIHDEAVAILKSIANVQIGRDDGWVDEDDGYEIASLDAIVATNGNVLPAHVIERGVRLRVIAGAGTQFDAAAEEAARTYGVQIVHAGNANNTTRDDHATIAVCEQIAHILRRRYTIASLPLQVVPVSQVILHENHDARRVAGLADRLLADGRLVNPPITIRQDRTYVVLDGATRLTAFRHLDLPYIVVQEVDRDRVDVSLHKWLHAVHGGTPESLLQMLTAIPGLCMRECRTGQQPEVVFGNGALGYVHLVTGQVFQLDAERTLPERQWLDVLNRTVAAYSQWGTVERTLDTNMTALVEQYPTLAGLFEFPTMQIETLLELAMDGYTIPAGITRFQIPGRILHLNAPLQRLIQVEPLLEKRQWLEDLIHKRMVRRQVRHYDEPVTLLDE